MGEVMQGRAKHGGTRTQEDGHHGKNLRGCGLPDVLVKRIPEGKSEGLVTVD